MRLPLTALCALLIAVSHASGAGAPDRFDPSHVPLEVDSPNPALAKIVLLAGTPSNRPGQHEYFAGCALISSWLRADRRVWPVMVRGGWPTHEAVLKNARTLVYFGDGGGKQPFLEPARWEIVRRLVDAGTGLVLLHQAVDLPKGNQSDDLLAWTGAAWRADIGCRGHWDITFAIHPGHPVLRGVKPFSAPKDGWLYNLHFTPSPRLVPLLTGAVPESSRTTADARAHPAREETIAWAFERPAGGRSFSFTGCDLHANWAIESQRRLVINGILWTAGLEVPAEGAPVPLHARDLEQNLDRK